MAPAASRATPSVTQTTPAGPGCAARSSRARGRRGTGRGPRRDPSHRGRARRCRAWRQRAAGDAAAATPRPPDPDAASIMSSTPGDSTISGGQVRAERSARCRSPHTVDVSGAMNQPRQGGEKSSARSALRRAAGTVSTTLKYGLLRARATSAKTTAPAASAASARRRPAVARQRPGRASPRAPRALTPRTAYPNGMPTASPRVSCQQAIAQPATTQPARIRSGRQPSRSDQPRPRQRQARARAMPPVESTLTWVICCSRHGAKPNPAPATTAPAGPEPSARARAYPPAMSPLRWPAARPG